MNTRVLGSKGDVSTKGAALDGSSGTEYIWSEVFAGSEANFSVHVQFANVSSLTTAVTLWATNIEDADAPSGADPTDWVQDTSVSFTGCAGSDAKELVEVGNAGSRFYALQFTSTAGTGNASAWVNHRK